MAEVSNITYNVCAFELKAFDRTLLRPSWLASNRQEARLKLLTRQPGAVL